MTPISPSEPTSMSDMVVDSTGCSMTRTMMGLMGCMTVRALRRSAEVAFLTLIPTAVSKFRYFQLAAHERQLRKRPDGHARRALGLPGLGFVGPGRAGDVEVGPRQSRPANSLRNIAAVHAPAGRPPVFIMSAISLRS